jgi:hypothetical protein
MSALTLDQRGRVLTFLKNTKKRKLTERNKPK